MKDLRSDKRTWIVCVDGGHARVFEQARPGVRIEELAERAMTAPPAPEESQQAGRVHDRLGPARHAVEARVKPHEAAEQKFIAAVAAKLEGWARDDAFDDLVLCAPPHAMGLLKQHLGAGRERVSREVLKDWVRYDEDEIARRLEALPAPD